MSGIANVLSIAGSDPSGGAGVQADLKTFSALGAYGMAAVTALTAQNTIGVRGVFPVAPEFVEDQLCAVFEDVRVDGVKIGMLADPQIIAVVADVLARYKPGHIVLDPVMVATSGDSLISVGAVEALVERLVPMCDVLTPNIPEGERLLRKSVMDMERSAHDLLGLGAGAVYLKGGHLKGSVVRDVLAVSGEDVCAVFEGPRLGDYRPFHGTGCTLSSALCVYLSQGGDLREAAFAAHNYVARAIFSADVLAVGNGSQPLCHFLAVKDEDAF